MTNGSHGCINLPYSIAQEIYGYVEKNTPVICYYLPGTEPEPLPEIPLELEPGLEAPQGAPEGTPVVPEAGVPVEPVVLPETVPQPEEISSEAGQ